MQDLLYNIKHSAMSQMIDKTLDHIRPINWPFIFFTIPGLIIWIALNPAPVEAAPIGVLDSLLDTMQAASGGWMNKALGYANILFFGLAAIEFTWSAIQLTLKKNDLQDIIVSTLFKVMSISFFAMLLAKSPVWIPMIMDSFSQAGVAVSGGGTPTTPSTIMGLGIDFAAKFVTAAVSAPTAATVAASSPTTSISGLLGATVSSMLTGVFSSIIIGLTGIAIVLAFAAVAAQLFMTLLESYIVMGGGALMLGFLGSRWTSNWGEKYFGYVVSVGIKLFVLYLIVGFGETVVNLLTTALQNLTLANKAPQLGDFFGMLSASAVYGTVGWMTPSIASTMMNGSPNMTMSNAGATGAAMAAAPVAAALSVGAAGAQAAGLVGKAFGGTKSAAAGGIGGSPASGGGFAGGVTGGTAALSRLTQSTGKAASGATSAMGGAASKGTQAAAGATSKGASAGVAAAGKMAGAAKGTESGGAALKGGSDAGSSVASNAGGNGFASSASGGGDKNATGGMAMSEGGANSAQRGFDADQRGDDKKTISDKLLDKSKDLQQAADRQKPNLPHDGGHGSGISIRFNHQE